MPPGWGMLLEQRPSTRTHNLQPHATPTTNHNQSYVPHAVKICIVSSSRWRAQRCPKHVERIISSISYCVASSWSFSPHTIDDGRTNTHKDLHMSMQRWWDDTEREQRKCLEKRTCTRAIFLTKNPTRTGLWPHSGCALMPWIMV